jgi:hypothetical protein
VFAVATTLSPAAAAQRTEPLTAARVRALAIEAEAEGKGDKTEIVLALDRKFRQRWGDFESFPISVLKREDLTVVLSLPFMTYRRTLVEYLRMEKPLAEVPWVAPAVITIGPLQIGAPDLTELVVTRDGKPVAPLENRLKPMSFANGNGETAVIHAGEVRFPVSAFAAGAQVAITALAANGERFVFAFDDSQLQNLK